MLLIFIIEYDINFNIGYGLDFIVISFYILIVMCMDSNGKFLFFSFMVIVFLNVVFVIMNLFDVISVSESEMVKMEFIVLIVIDVEFDLFICLIIIIGLFLMEFVLLS